jgi:hypothetical protein
MSSKKYMIINTTVRPVRKCPKTGKDLRSAAEKKGYRVQWRDERDSVRSVSPAEWGSNPVIVADLSDSLLRFVEEGIIQIKTIDNIGDVLKDYSAKAEEKVKSSAEVEASEEPTPKQVKKKKASTRKAKASEMSKADSKEVAAEKNSEYPGAVNPDGENNFTVTAGSKTAANEVKSDGGNA